MCSCASNTIYFLSFAEDMTVIILFAGGSKNGSASAEAEDAKAASEVEVTQTDQTNGEVSDPKPEAVLESQETEQDESGGESTQTTFSYEQLRAKSENPVTGIDFKRREVGCFMILITFCW